MLHPDDCGNYCQAVKTIVEPAQEVGLTEIVMQLKAPVELNCEVVVQTIMLIVARLGAADMRSTSRSGLDDIIVALQEQITVDQVIFDGFGMVVIALFTHMNAHQTHVVLYR